MEKENKVYIWMLFGSGVLGILSYLQYRSLKKEK